MAIGVLTVFDKNTRENVIDVLINRYFKEFGMDCLELACICECENFLSCSIVQQVLDKIWIGRDDCGVEPVRVTVHSNVSQIRTLLGKKIEEKRGFFKSVEDTFYVKNHYLLIGFMKV